MYLSIALAVILMAVVVPFSMSGKGKSDAVNSADDVESRLLAGDCFYARGLRGIAARGDTAAVGLLQAARYGAWQLKAEAVALAQHHAPGRVVAHAGGARQVHQVLAGHRAEQRHHAR
mgnify:CR=1 FL=1